PWHREFCDSSRRRHTRFSRDWSPDVCSSDLVPAVAGRPGLGSRLHRADHGALHHQHLRQVSQQGQGALGMAVVSTRSGRIGNRIAIAAVIVITLIFLSPIYWITSTAFKPLVQSTSVPPTIVFQPEVTPFVKLFVKRAQLTAPVSQEVYDAAPWWEKLVLDGGERLARDGKGNVVYSAYPDRFINSLIIAITSTFLAVSLGTITAYGFSRFKVKGEADLLFFILSTRMLPPIVVAIPMFLMYRAVGLNDTHFGLILLYTAFNVSFAVWLMKGFIDEIPKEYEEAA